MQRLASIPVDRFEEALGRLPAGLDLDRLARETKAIERGREISSGAGLLRLALARGPGGLSLSQTAAWADLLGLGRLSDPAVKKRLDKAVGFLAAVLGCQLAAKQPGAAVRWAGRVLRCGDGSCVREPGPQPTRWRVHGVYDLGAAGFSHLELTDEHAGEGIDRGAPVAGEVRILDRAYARTGKLRRFRLESAEQADFIVRTGWNAFRLMTPQGSRFDLIGHLRTLADDTTPHEIAVQALSGAHDPPLPMRLIIQRKTAKAVTEAHKTLRREAQRRQKQLDPRSRVAAAFTILATSLPAEAYPAAEVLGVYRLRWQIELAFKRLKSSLGIERLPTHTPQASRSWLLAHLILAVMCDELSQEVLDSSP